jgi:uncharacterized protein with HEPN domain
MRFLSRDWRLYLEDISSACGKITGYLAGQERAGFARDSMVFDAILQNLLVVGEASKRLPDGIKARMPSIQWRAIAGMRDIVAHGYFSLDVDLVWDTASHKIPELKQDIDRVLSEP